MDRPALPVNLFLPPLPLSLPLPPLLLLRQRLLCGAAQPRLTGDEQESCRCARRPDMAGGWHVVSVTSSRPCNLTLDDCPPQTPQQPCACLQGVYFSRMMKRTAIGAELCSNMKQRGVFMTLNTLQIFSSPVN